MLPTLLYILLCQGAGRVYGSPRPRMAFCAIDRVYPALKYPFPRYEAPLTLHQMKDQDSLREQDISKPGISLDRARPRDAH